MHIGGWQPCTFSDFPGHLAAIVFTVGCNLRCGYCHNPELVHGAGTLLSQEDILHKLQQRVGKLNGVVLSGGEALLQPDLLAFAQRCRNMGYAIKLDSNGTQPRALAKALQSGLIDYVALDVKDLPGTSSLAPNCLRESIALVLEHEIAHEFRTTVLAPQHDRERLCALADTLRGGKQWWLQRVQAGNLLDSQLRPQPPNDECLQAVQAYAQGKGLTTGIR